MKPRPRAINRTTTGRTLRIALATAAAVGMAAMVPTSASATEPEIHGFTEEAFVTAAVSQGVAAKTANRAWGNEDAMARIPVASYAFPGVSKPKPALLGTAAAAAALTSASGSCYKYWTNVIGAEIQRVTLNKQWSYSGATISSPAVQFYGRAGWPYVFDGLVGSNDYYSTAYENSHGTHTSYRQGKFTESLSGGADNASVTLVSKLAGAYTCSYGGGV